MIHPSIRAKADKLGLIGEDNPKQLALGVTSKGDVVQFHWPSKNVYAFGVGAKAAMAEMEAIMAIARMDVDWRILNVARDPFLIELFSPDRSRTFIRGGATPQDTLAELNGKDGEREWLSTTVPEDGAEAFKQGFVAGDNPYRESGEPFDGGDNEEAADWDAAFDEAADAAQAEADAEEDRVTGSVVKETYRLRYAEAGHPNHCGDWLADTLNNLVLGKSATDMVNLEALFDVNGISTAKYKHEGNGWQGRIRMTGRNLLARKLYVTGFLHIPESLLPMTGGTTPLRVPAEWIETRPYKGKSALESEEYLASGVSTGQLVAAEEAVPPLMDALVAAAPPEDTPIVDVAAQMARIRKSKGKK